MCSYKKQWDKMTHAQFLQKEVISLAEEMKWWSPDLLRASPPHSASFRMAGQIAPGLYIWGRKRWEIYTPWPKRTCLSYLLIPGIILPGSSLEEKEREKEEEPSSEMPKQLHCFNMFRPAPLDDRDTSGRGLIHGLHPQWTSSRDGLSLNNCEAL